MLCAADGLRFLRVVYFSSGLNPDTWKQPMRLYPDQQKKRAVYFYPSEE